MDVTCVSSYMLPHATVLLDRSLTRSRSSIVTPLKRYKVIWPFKPVRPDEIPLDAVSVE